MLRKSLTLVCTAVLVLGLCTVGCNKKKSGDKGGGGAMDPTMEPEPMGMPVEMAADPMDPMDPMDPDDDMAADPTIPTKGQATARMILIGWKESAGPAETKRTKAEAKTLADKVLKEANAKPGDEKHFIALVKKHADAFKENGGQVGPFNPKEGMPYIVKAVFPLKVGGISGIVETKAGFHIFMRTK